jgi:hypothetical protein
MRTTLCLLLSATVCLAGWQDENPHKDDYRRTLAWLGEPVAWSNVTITVTDQVPSDEQAQAVYGWYWFLAGKVQAYGAKVPVSRVELMTAMDKAKDEARKAGDRDKVDAIVADGLYLLVAWDAVQGNTRDDAWWATPPPDGKAATVVTTNTVPVVTRYRWQDHKFTSAPTTEADLQ